MVLGTFLDVIRSVGSCLLRHRRERPGTLLRTLCVVAFDFMARAGGRRLGPEKRRALSCLLDLGALINDHFDQRCFCKCSYRKLRKRLSVNESVRAAYRDYFRELRQAERSRPRLCLPRRDDVPKESADYRERVVRISLSALAAVAFGQPNGDNLEDRRTSPAQDACLPQLFALVMLIQICDDLFDWRRDWRAGLPTFATAELLRCAGQAEGGGPDFGRVRAQRRNGGGDVSGRSFQAEIRILAVCALRYAAFFLVKLLSNVALRGRARREATDNAGFGVLQVNPRC